RKREQFPMKLSDPELLREQCYIDGEWIGAADGKRTPVHNPADGSIVGSVPWLGAAETRDAIQAAQRAWPAWRARTAKERGAILRRWAELLLAHREDLAMLLTAEQGKPLPEARGEIAYAAS